MAVPVRPDPPESSSDLRVSDAERSRAVDILRQQMTEGRLDLMEFEERTTSVMAARRRREVAPLFADLPVRWEPEDLHRPAPAPTRRRRALSRELRGYLAVFGAVMVLLWGIWLWISIASGSLDFAWPVFPMLGMGVPVLIAFFRHLLGVADDA